MIVTRQPIHHLARQAFTILELIVAIAITVIMLFLINALFVATSNGVSMGMALSDVIGAGRAIGDQIERDSEEQLTPIQGNPGPGVLVIVCEKRDNTPYRFRGVEKPRSARSDQLMFTRRLGNSSNGFAASPITPIDNSTYSSASKTQMAGATAIRVWYGHVLKTNEAGTGVTDLGAEGRNKFANQWALGRHALYFVGGTTVPSFNHSVGATANATLSGHVTGGTLLFHGITDVAYMGYSGDATIAPGAFVATGVPASSFSASTLWTEDSESDYDSKALSYMFVSPNRLWANPFPKVAATQTATWVTAGQIAQMHPLLMDNVSDFIVEFAADAVDDGDPNTMTAEGFDGEPDRNALGEVIWYGYGPNDDTNSVGAPSWNTRGIVGLVSPVVQSPPAGTVAYVFRHGDGNQHLWPYMIRIRYRVHDSRAELGGDKSPEPGDGTNAGRWFEQIIKVKRD